MNSLKFLLRLSALVLLLSSSKLANAADTNWTGADGGVWTTVGNWSNGVPNNTGTATISIGADPFYSIVSTTSDIQNITVNATAANGTLTLSGGTLTTDENSGAITSNTNNPDIVVSSNLSIGTGTVLTIADNAATTTTTISGVVSGAGGLTKTGAGTLLVTQQSTYTGATTVSAGTIDYQGLAITGAGDFTVDAGATLRLNLTNETAGVAKIEGAGSIVLPGNTVLTTTTAANTTFSGVLSGTGGLTKAGTGNLTLSGANTNTGPISVAAGTITVDVGGTIEDASSVSVAGTLSLADTLTAASATVQNLSGAGAVSVGTNKTIIVDSDANTTFSGIISGASNGAVTKNGAATLTLSGINTYVGTTTVNAGTLELSGNGTLGNGTGALTMTGTASLDIVTGAGAKSTGDLTGATGNTINLNNNTLTVTQGTNSSAFAGVISGSGGFTKAGAADLTFSGVNTYSGNNTLNAGTVELSGTGTLGSGAGTLTMTGTAALNLAASSGTKTVGTLTGATTNTIALGSGSTLSVTQGAGTTFAGVMSGAGGFTKNGTADLTLSNANTYTGTTTVEGASTLTFTGSTASLTGPLVNNASVIFNQTADSSFSGNISGTGSITKQGTTNLTLSGTNSYGGTATVDAGTLTITGDTTGVTGNLVNNATVTFNPAADTTFTPIISGAGAFNKTGSTNLTLGGANTIGGAISVTNGTLTFTGSTTGITGAMTNAGSVVFNQTANSNFNTQISGAGTLEQRGSATLTLANANNNFSGNLTVTSGTVEFTAATNQITGNIINNSALNFNQTNSTSLSSVISGTGTLAQNGTGTLTLSGNNTFSGTATINTGTLAFTGAMVNTTGNIVNNSNLSLAPANDATYPGVISGAGAISKSDFNVLTLSGTNTYSGTFTVTEGTLTLTGNTASITGPLVNNAQVNFNPSADTSFSSVISGNGTLFKQGGNVLTLSGNSTYSGLLTVSDGGLVLTGDTGGITGNLVIDTNGEVTFNRSTTNVEFGETISGAGILNKSGTNTLTLSGILSNTGTTNVTAGTLTITGNSGGATATMNNSAAVIFNPGADTSYLGAILGTGTIEKQGATTLTLGGVNTFSGTTTVTAGTLSFSNSMANITGNISVANGATLNYNGDANTTYSSVISGQGGISVTGFSEWTLAGANTYTGTTTVSSFLQYTGSTAALTGNLVNSGTVTFNASADTSFPGIISGVGNVVKESGNVLELSAANTHSGPTVITAGTLNYSGDVAGITGMLTVNGGATALFSRGTDTTFSPLITGAGNLTKSNAGNLTLASNVALTGTVTISGGTLTFTGDPVNMTANTVNNSQLVLNPSANASWNSVISGAGTIEKQGTAEIAIGSACTYSGLATVTAGTLSFEADTSQITGNLAIPAGGTAVFNASAETSFSPVISGGGTLIMRSDQQLTLSGVNTFNGAFNVENGLVLLTADTSGMGGSLNISINGDVTFNQPNNSSYSGVISGAGDWSQVSTTNLTLSGASTFSGAGFLLGGTTTFTGDTSNITGVLSNSAALVFNPTANTSFSGIITGSGTVTKSGSNTLTLTGANNYTGGTTIAGGTLSGDTTGLQGDIAIGTNTLQFNQNTDGTYAGVLSGTGTLNKSGTGVVTLTGTSTFTGATGVDAGTLFVNGTLLGTATANAGGTLGGTGTIANVINNGTVAPGNSIGTLNISGNYTQGAGGTLDIEFDTTGATDLLNVTGVATLAGTLNAIPAAGTYAQGQQFNFLNAAGGIVGSFATLTDAHPQTFYYVRVGNLGYIVTNQRFLNAPFYNGLKPNAKKTYDFLTSNPGAVNDPNLINLLNTLSTLTSTAQLQDALQQMSPAQYSALALISYQNNVNMAGATLQQSRASICSEQYVNERATIWVAPVGYYYNQNALCELYPFYNFTYGTAVGSFLPVGDGFFVNPAIGYTHSNFAWKSSRGKGHADTLYLSPSFGFCNGPFFISLIAQGNIDLFKATREIKFTGYNEKPQTNHKNYSFLFGVDLGSKIQLRNKPSRAQRKEARAQHRKLTRFRRRKSRNSNAVAPANTGRSGFFIQPEGRFYYTNTYQQAFTENSGGYLNLKLNRKRTTFIQPNLAVKLIQEFSVRDYCLAPAITLGALANLPLGDRGYHAKFNNLFTAGAATRFVNDGYYNNVYQFVAGAEFVMKKNDNFTFKVGYTAEVFSHMAISLLNFKLNWNF